MKKGVKKNIVKRIIFKKIKILFDSIEEREDCNITDDKLDELIKLENIRNLIEKYL